MTKQYKYIYCNNCEALTMHINNYCEVCGSRATENPN